ncbi:MAG: M28 family peptidase [Bacteroidia bacterium]|nr:M28 family peptidase [Bacteroidia bacterium]
MKHIKITILAIVSGFLLVACAPRTSDSSSDESSTSVDENSPLQDINNLISIDNVTQHLEYLAGPEIGGRASGSADNLLACEYVADQFQELGLTPYSETTGYLQPYLQPYTRIFDEYFSFELSNIAHTSSVNYRYAYDLQFFYGNFSAFGTVFSGKEFDGQGELIVFDNVSYDYADKIVLVESISSAILTDLYNDGAKGAIISDSGVTYPQVEYGQGDMFDDSDFLMLYAKPSSFDAMILNIANGLSQADVSYSVDTASKTVNNVVGILDVGATSSIIVSSHIDHLGRFDAEDDGYYAGALDNASGVAGMLELARIYSENINRIKKNVIFIAYNGEEAGLYGSQHYSTNMVGTASSTRAAFNIDMIGGGSNDYDLEIIGNYGNLANSINSTCAEYGISNYSLYGNQANSDHYWLGAMRITSISFVHFDDRFYHTPNDTIDKINYDVFSNQLKMISALMLSSYNK